MNREELRRYIMEEYHAENDFPWLRYPENEVFRHPGNRKWFALIMEVTGDRLGLPDQEKHAVVNLKCDPVLAGSLRASGTVLPAYHMNKEKWISVLLDGSVEEEHMISLQRPQATCFIRTAGQLLHLQVNKSVDGNFIMIYRAGTKQIDTDRITIGPVIQIDIVPRSHGLQNWQDAAFG